MKHKIKYHTPSTYHDIIDDLNLLENFRNEFIIGCIPIKLIFKQTTKQASKRLKEFYKNQMTLNPHSQEIMTQEIRLRANCTENKK